MSCQCAEQWAKGKVASCNGCTQEYPATVPVDPWAYLDEDRPQGVCYDCGMPYNLFADLLVDDWVWELINPTEHEGAGLLCPTCICNRIRVLGLKYPIALQIRG